MKRLLPLFFLLPLPALAQATLHQQGYWGRVFVRARLSEHLTFHSEFDERRLAFPDGQWQFITHQHLHYRLSPTWDAAAGLTFSWQPQRGITVPERRVFEEATATLPVLGRLRLMPRLRVEQRWLRQVVAGDLADGWGAARLRFRTRLQLDYPVNPRWKVRVSDELMLTTDGFDQNRVYAAAERQLGAGFAAELGSLWMYQRRAADAGYFDRDVLRLTLFKDLSLVARP